MQYFITYVLGYYPTSGKKAELGTIVHKVMECLAGLKKELQNASPRTKKLVLNDDAVGKIVIDRSDLLSSTLPNDLLEKSFDYYTKQSEHAFSKGDKEECRKLVWDTLNFNNGQFDPRNRNIIAAEPHFDIPIDEDWAHYEYEINGEKIKGQLAIKGTIDLVTKVDDNTIEAVDWKTGKRLDWATGEEKTIEKLQSDPQLLLYNYALSKLFPEYKQSIMSIFFIKDGGPFSLCFDNSDHDRFLKMLKIRFQDIQQNNNPKPISEDRNNWKCTKLCHYCKNKWQNTDTNMCQYVDDYLKNNGMKKTIANLTKSDFNIGFYSAPG
jgi:hypothetical protein